MMYTNFIYHHNNNQTDEELVEDTDQKDHRWPRVVPEGPRTEWSHTAIEGRSPSVHALATESWNVKVRLLITV